MHGLILPIYDIIFSEDNIMDKLDLILEKLNKLDKIETDINALKNDNKKTHQQLNMIIDEVASIKEIVTDHDIKIKKAQ
jgi:hypothetical protein